jgi:hypothetical protein
MLRLRFREVCARRPTVWMVFLALLLTSNESVIAGNKPYGVRLHVILLANNDGKNAADITPAQFQLEVDKANEIYASGGVSFLFDPNPNGPDWERLNNTLMNEVSTSASDPQAPQRGAALMAYASRYPGQLVVYYHHGPGTGPDGQGWSGRDSNYVIMPWFSTESLCGKKPLNHLAHEIGHYLFLQHDHVEFATVADAGAHLAAKNNNLGAAFDGDGLSDTPPTPYVGAEDCKHPDSFTLNGQNVSVTRNNIMSYWDCDPKWASPKQLERIRIAALGHDLVADPLSVVSWGPNRLDAVTVAIDGRLWHQWWDGSAWGTPHPLGSASFISSPVAISRGLNLLDIFAVGSDQALWHISWDGSDWTPWHSLGGTWRFAPSVVSWGPNRIDVFSLGTDRAVWHTWRDGSTWGSWHSLGGGLATPPQAVAWGPNRLDVIAVGLDRVLYHNAWTGSAWQSWAPLDDRKWILPPRLVSWGANRLDIFAVGHDMALWHQWLSGSEWGTWQSLGGEFYSPPQVIAFKANRLDVFALGPDHDLKHIAWDGTGWSPLESLGGQLLGMPHAVSWGPIHQGIPKPDLFRVDVFSKAPGPAPLWHKTWDSNGWQGWEKVFTF